MITPDSLRRSPFRLAMHIRLGKGGFVRVARCIAYPRFTVERERASAREPIKTTLLVDDIEVATLDDVAARLNQPAAEAST